MALTGNTLAATVNGYRARAEKVWFPTSGAWVADGSSAGITLSASAPTTTATGSTSSGNKYGQIIKVTTPSNAGISSIQSLSISFYVYDRNTTAGTLYGSLRTTYTDSGSGDTVAFFRTNAVGSEASATSISSSSTSPTKLTFTFSGSISQNTSYYLFLYTKSTSDIYGFGNDYLSSASITYTKKSYTVSYNANGGSGAPSSQTKIYDETLTLSSTKPTKSNGSNAVTGSFVITGNANGGYFGNTSTTTTTITATTSRTDTITYTFSSWNTASGGSGTSYAAGGSYTANSAATLYAQYSSSTSTGTTSYTNNSISGLATPSRGNSTIATYTVTFDANGGSCSTTQLTSQKTRSYNFRGWAETNNATTTLASNKTYTAAKTVYAVWGNSDSTAAITLPTPTRSGYTFRGWATSSSATSGITGSYTPEGDVTFVAIWSQDYSTVYYNNNGSCVACCVYYNNNGTAVLCNVYYNNNGSAVQI